MFKLLEDKPKSTKGLRKAYIIIKPETSNLLRAKLGSLSRLARSIDTDPEGFINLILQGPQLPPKK